ncbi:MAG: sigma-70 family RNA polymerase sigma factor [Acidobacteriia bacterium]|nr:sigma-70 family RNA polymerase sigma factor [Terriglobia bacterium]
MTADQFVDGAYWVNLVRNISRENDQGVEQLYSLLSAHVRAALSRTVGPDAREDLVHEVLVIVLEAIRAGELRDPTRLMGFVRRIAQRRAVAHIRQLVFRRRRFVLSDAAEPRAPLRDSPDTGVDRNDRFERARRALRRLTPRDREILERFYLREQPRAQICFEMRLTDTQFRLFKSRAIARCSTFAQPSRPARSESRIA